MFVCFTYTQLAFFSYVILVVITLCQDYDIERYVRDCRVHQILEGTNEIMRHIVGKALVS